MRNGGCVFRGQRTWGEQGAHQGLCKAENQIWNPSFPLPKNAFPSIALGQFPRLAMRVTPAFTVCQASDSLLHLLLHPGGSWGWHPHWGFGGQRPSQLLGALYRKRREALGWRAASLVKAIGERNPGVRGSAVWQSWKGSWQTSRRIPGGRNRPREQKAH